MFGVAKRDAPYSPAVQAQIAKDYQEHLKIAPDSFKGTEFADYASGLPKDCQAFKATKGPTNLDLYAKLNSDTQAGAAVRTELARVLAYNDEDQKNYEAYINAYKQILEQVPQKYRVEQIIRGFEEICRDPSTKAIVKQQKERENALENLFNDTTFINNLCNACDIPADRQNQDIALIKTNMLSSLKEAHTKQQKQFEDTTGNLLTQLHKASAEELATRQYLATLYTYNEHMSAEIKKKMQLGKGGIQRGSNPKRALPDMDKLDKMLTRSKRTITHDDDKSSITLPRRILAAFSSLDVDKEIADMIYDFKQRHPSSDSIIINSDFAEKELALERGRAAVAQSIEQGYDLSKVTVKVNGEEIKQSELFSGHEEYLDKLKKRSTEMEEKFKAIQPSKNPKGYINTNTIKQEVAKLINAAKKAELNPAGSLKPPSTTPTPGENSLPAGTTPPSSATQTGSPDDSPGSSGNKIPTA